MPYEKMASRLGELLPQQLFDHCSAVQADNSHEPFCYELFRRAIVERSEPCWAMLYQRYQKLVGHWLLDSSKSAQPPADAVLEEMVLDAFAAFWRAFTPEKLQQVDGLGSILFYLKACAATTVLLLRRKLAQEHKYTRWEQLGVKVENLVADPGGNPEAQMVSQLRADQVWAMVDECCTDQKERIIARLSFVADLKPRAILELHTDLFSTVDEIYLLRKNLKNRLRRDPRLRELWGQATDETNLSDIG